MQFQWVMTKSLKSVAQELVGHVPVSECIERNFSPFQKKAQSLKNFQLTSPKGGRHSRNITIINPNILPLQLVAQTLLCFMQWGSVCFSIHSYTSIHISTLLLHSAPFSWKLYSRSTRVPSLNSFLILSLNTSSLTLLFW